MSRHQPLHSTCAIQSLCLVIISLGNSIHQLQLHSPQNPQKLHQFVCYFNVCWGAQSDTCQKHLLRFHTGLKKKKIGRRTLLFLQFTIHAKLPICGCIFQFAVPLLSIKSQLSISLEWGRDAQTGSVMETSLVMWPYLSGVCGKCMARGGYTVLTT